MRAATRVAAAAGIAAACLAAPAAARIGGGCVYRDVPGVCTIASVKKTAASMHQTEVGGGPGYEGYAVTFTYKDGGDADAQAQEGRDHDFRLTNSWYPGPAYLEKYGIKPGVIFACKLRIRTAGPCSPIGFDFPTIDRTDYFETKR